MKKKVVDPTNAKGSEYKEVINTIDKEGECPFCPQNFKYHKKPILIRHGSWFLTENSWPYKNAAHHFLIMNKVHKEKFSQLSARDFHHVNFLVNWANQKFKIKGGGLALRFGDTKYTGATVCHLHFHLVVPKLDRNEKSIAIQFPFG